MRKISRILLCLAASSQLLLAGESELLLLVREVPSNGIVLAEVNLARTFSSAAPGVDSISVSASLQGQDVPVQLVSPPGNDEDGLHTVLLRLPKGGENRVLLKFRNSASTNSVTAVCSVRTKWFTAIHDPAKLGGLPSRFEFLKTGKIISDKNFSWQDRLYHRQNGGFTLRGDPVPAVTMVSEGPICSVVRVRCGYWQGKSQPDSKPAATYDWFYFHDMPLISVRALVCQQSEFAWDEIHFLEMNYSDDSFKQWAGGEPFARGEFVSTNKSFGFPGWGALIDGTDAVAMFQAGQALFHDGKGQRYLQADGDAAWRGWKERRRQMSAWLWLGNDTDPIAAVRRSAELLPGRKAILTTVQVRQGIDKLLASAAGDDSTAGQKRWLAAMAENMESLGRLNDVQAWLDNKPPATWTNLMSGDLAVGLEKTAGGIACRSLFDKKTGRELLSPHAPPLFEVTLRNLAGSNEVHLSSDTGWGQVTIASGGDRKRGHGLEICWGKPEEGGLSDLSIKALMVAQASKSPADGVAWHLSVDNVPKGWTLLTVAFPQVAVGDTGGNLSAFFPRGPGEVKKDLTRQAFHYGGTYPNGWTTMQFLAAYDEKIRTGLYFAMHDGDGNTKDIALNSRISQADILMKFSFPVPDMGVAGNRFALPGPAVWKILRGDWYDAARIYRDWAGGGPGVEPGAKWWPSLTADGREDTPMWMRELPAWAQGGGEPKTFVPAVRKFQQYLGLPAGVHWYNWHQIPFDNDYPHYFPYKDGFVEGVRELQLNGVYVMPYINGRLWDIHDKGVEDFEFTKNAEPFATKDENGKVLTESYGSKEADGQRVVLAAMCPYTKFWQKKVQEIVLRIMNEGGTRGVYIDQIAAAQPKLCFDKSHGHPLGGGNWWWQGYVRMLSDLRRAMPKDCMITSECNAEPYLRWFDGYLTWHWQFDGQVPAFPAVYGGTIQMFGRAYRGGPTRDLAARMKAGQQLVFGEQIGWCGPEIVDHKDSAEFFRQAVQLRWTLRRYFYAGQMTRPPRLAGEIPSVTADWQWSGSWPVTTDAVLTGAWRQEKDNRLVLIFANVSDAPVSSDLKLDLKGYGFKDDRKVRVTVIGPKVKGEQTESPVLLERKITLEAQQITALEIEQ